MVNTIQRTKQKFTVSPSATATRMGVVRTETPNITGLLEGVNKSVNSIAERQIKILDAKWITDYEVKASTYINNNVNEQLLTGELPDLELFTEQMQSYNQGVLNEVPERLKIVADNFFQTKYMASFDILKNQSNKVMTQQSNDSYVLWKNNLLTDAENQYHQIAISASDADDAIQSIHNYSNTVLKSALIKHKELYTNTYDTSEDPLDLSQLRISELNILEQLEVSRNNAILRSFYQGVDLFNEQEVGFADLMANNYINNYLLDKENVRGLNYDVFKTETGISVGEETISNVLQKNKSYLAQIQSTNVNGKIEKDAEVKEKNVLKIDQLTKAIGDPANLENGFFLEPSGLSPGPGAPAVPFTYETFKNYINKDQGLDATDKEILKMYNLNNDKYLMNAVQNKALQNFDKPGMNFSDLINSSEFDDVVSSMGGKDKVIEAYYSRVLNQFGYSDSINWYDNQDEMVLENSVYLFRKENHVPSGFDSWLKGVDLNLMETGTQEEIEDMLFKRMSIYNYATVGGIKGIDGMSIDTMKTYDMIKSYTDKGVSYKDTALMIQKKLNQTDDETQTISTRNETYINDNLTNSENLFIKYFVDVTKAAYNDGIEAGTPIINGVKAFPLPDSITDAKRQGREFYLKNQYQIDHILSTVTKDYMDSISLTSDDDEQREKKHYMAIKAALNTMSKSNYGSSKFMDNVSGESYRHLPIESMHNNLTSNEIKDSMSAYAYNNINKIGNDPEHPQYESIVNQFTVTMMDGTKKFVMPTIDKVQELVQNGNIYVKSVDMGLTGKSSMYSLIIANSGTGYDEPFGYNTMENVSYDGSMFNPNIYTYNGILTKENLKSAMDAASAIADGKGVFDAVQADYTKPIWRSLASLVGKIDIDEDYAQLLQQLYTNDSFYNYQMYQNDNKEMLFDSFENQKETFSSINNEYEGTQTYTDKELNDTFDYVNETYENQTASTKGFISLLLLDNPNIKFRDNIFREIESGNLDFIKILAEGKPYENALDNYFLQLNIFELQDG
jgi:hypothetical protein